MTTYGFKHAVILTPKDLADWETLKEKPYFDDLIRNFNEQMADSSFGWFHSASYDGFIPQDKPRGYELAEPNAEIDYKRITIEVKPKKD